MNGVGVIVEGIGIPHTVATIFAAVIVISFAATSLDTSVRLQRYIIGELGVQYRLKVLQNRWLATLVAVGSSALLALGLDRGAGGMRIWPLFGTTNQLLAGLTLLIVSLFLLRLRRPAWAPYSLARYCAISMERRSGRIAPARAELCREGHRAR